MNALSPRPQKRTANTCVTCRARKVRCDGRPGLCTNCERLSFQCSYDDTVVHREDHGFDDVDYAVESNVGVGSGVAVPRRRVRQACLRCHAKKAKCSGTLPKCDRCQVQGLDCIYRPGKRTLALSILAGGPDSLEVTHLSNASAFDRSVTPAKVGSPINIAGVPSPMAHATPTPDEGLDGLAMRAFDNFFRHVHHLPIFSFLHRASLMQRYHTGQLDRALLLALIGITSLLTELGTTAEQGNRCIDEAAALVLGELEKPSVLRLQALVIVVKHRILSRRFSSAFMLHATACRFASALRLNYENPNLGFLARESRRRLMWSLYIIDSSIADGQADLAIWPRAERQIHLQLPCNERNFEFDLPEPTEPLQPPPPETDGTLVPLPDDVGFLALHVRIQWIRCRILQYTVKVLCSPTTEIATLPTRCAELMGDLQAFEERLPLSFRWSENNLRLRMYSPRLCIFIMTHVTWQQCYLDLYRLFLSGIKESLPVHILGRLDPQTIIAGRSQCFEHAKSLVGMFERVLALENGVPVTDLDLPSSAYQCARVLDYGRRNHGEELGLTHDAALQFVALCKQVASRFIGVPACAAIVSDIDKLMNGGAAVDVGRLGSPATGIPALDQPYPPADSTGGMVIDPVVVPDRTAQAPVPAPMSTMSMEAAGASQQPQNSQTAGTPGSQSASEVSIGAAQGKGNAFDGALEGINFGPDSFDMDWTTALSEDWFNLGPYRAGMDADP